MAIYKNVEPLGIVSWTATGHHDYDEGFADGVDFVIEKLDALSEEDVAPREAGKWLLPSENKMNKSWDGLGVVCSKCKMFSDSDFDFCPNCGAHMQRVKEYRLKYERRQIRDE